MKPSTEHTPNRTSKTCPVCGEKFVSMGTAPAEDQLAQHEYKVHPTLSLLMAVGTITKDGSSFVATAADGQEVQFGCEASQVERYLVANPTPDKW